MKEKCPSRRITGQGVGFVACYRGKEIAFAKRFDTLVNKPSVKRKLGNKGLLIKHTVPEGMIAVY